MTLVAWLAVIAAVAFTLIFTWGLIIKITVRWIVNDLRDLGVTIGVDHPGNGSS